MRNCRGVHDDPFFHLELKQAWQRQARFVSGLAASFGLTNGGQILHRASLCYCLLAHVQVWIQQNLTDRRGLSQYRLRKRCRIINSKEIIRRSPCHIWLTSPRGWLKLQQ